MSGLVRGTWAFLFDRIEREDEPFIVLAERGKLSFVDVASLACACGLSPRDALRLFKVVLASYRPDWGYYVP